MNELWDNSIHAEILYNENPRNDKQMDYAVSNRIPFMLFIGENELKENKVKIKCMANGEEIMIEREKLIDEIKLLKTKEELLHVKPQEKENKQNQKKEKNKKEKKDNNQPKEEKKE